ARIQAEPDNAPLLAQELDALEETTAHINVPLSYADELYALRNNISLVRRKLPRTAAP
ncbi:MAG: C4-dicarboxylate ABC transporter substrate-binding protein, partial [Ramlibacter sp.]